MKPSLLAAVLALSAPTFADTTSESLHLGGPGSFGCNGSSPGTLCDGVTLGSAQMDFTLDTAAMTLTLVVTNTSPDDGGPNPVITQIHFNAPRQVTGLALIGQSAAGAGTPGYTASFDADLLDGSNGLKAAGGMGAFSVEMDNGNGVHGAIANANAASFGVNTNHLVFGPVTFVFGLTGDLTGVDASFFTKSLSMNPPGDRTVNAAAHFQAGGQDAEYSGTISDNSSDCDPLYYFEGTPSIGGSIDLIVSGQKGCHGCILLSDSDTPTKISPKITLDIGPTFLVALPVEFNEGGLQKIPTPIPNLPGLVGLTFYSQWVAGNPPLVQLSNVIDVTIVGL
ncbi:MAG: hypothetical protein RL885_27575 [Planctomycetota bacterium]